MLAGHSGVGGEGGKAPSVEGMTVAKKQAKKINGNGANLGFEQTLWLAADKLRNNLDAA